MESLSFNVPEEMANYVEEVVWTSTTTEGLPILTKAEVCRSIMLAGFVAVREGDVSVQGHDIQEFEPAANDADIQQMKEDLERSERDGGGVPAECHQCEYDWIYTGDLDQATCPNCSATVKIE